MVPSTSRFQPVRTGCLIALLCLAPGCGDLAVDDASDAVQVNVVPDASFLPDAGDWDDAGNEDLTAPEDAEAADVAADLWSPDVGTGCEGEQCSCVTNNECDSGFCIETVSGKQCAKSCVSECPDGFGCKTVETSGGDLLSICVPRFPRLCQPCKADADCATGVGDDTALCLDYEGASGVIGSFCGGMCDAANPCPAGYSCEQKPGEGDDKPGQCRRDDATCPCTARAITLSLSTLCSVANAVGACGGTRTCSEDGLSDCNAPQAVVETCNTKDDDCDGQTDEAEAGVCSDNNPCTYDNCVSGACQHPAAPGACDDGNACTKGGACAAGECATEPVVCDDDNPCTADACEPATGCTQVADNGATCSDGSVCTVGDACDAGACLPGAATVCDDGNTCTDDSCAPDTGCVFTANTMGCDDGDACTLADTCKDAACGHISTLECGDGNPCTDDACDAKTACSHTHNTADCDDNNVCTVKQTCKAGVCTPVAVKDCEDNNGCTTDACEPAQGCVHTNNTLPCSDDSVCTVGDTCEAGACKPGPTRACNDNNGCTDDACDGVKGCVNLANQVTCTDGNACTLDDACKGGACASGTAVQCDDNNPCTDDACHTATGCKNAANNLPCSDGNICTEDDNCAGGKCVAGKPKACDDGNPCTTEVCDAAKGCVSISNSESCTDGNACTEGDGCAGGKCVPGKAKVCTDANPCTDNTCDPLEGCVTTANQAPCSDGSACTGPDACVATKCVAGPQANCDDGNVCTNDGCDGAKGCTNEHNTDACSDGNVCSVKDLCVSGGCVPGAAKDCNDNDVCTDDACHYQTGCTNKHNTAPCSDGSVCTTTDICASGKCVAGPKLVCNDGNVCTNDSCDKAKGCVHTNNSVGCSDGTVCTVTDVCAGGKCVSGAAKNCDDKNGCTDDSCHPTKGCVNANNKAPCSDGTVCTTTDICTSGKCVAGAKLVCDDGNPCTTDSCDSAKGCQTKSLANGAKCGDPQGWCQSGGCQCKPGYVGNGLSCSDINECAVNNGGCHANAACTNTAGSFSCKCKSGYTGDGKTCGDVNECAVNNGGCSSNATCTNTTGSYSCKCKSGFTGDGKTCSDINECAVNNGGCSKYATCTNTTGSYSCKCKSGFTGDGKTCSDINECAVNNGGCHANATCTNTLGSRTCKCKAGYSGNGLSCTPSLPSQCSSHLVFNDKTRHVNWAGSASCDLSVNNKWYRFTGASGTKMPTSPPPTSRCGTHAPGWLSGSHPSAGQGQVSRKVCFNWSGKTCRWSQTIQVINCNGFYIYQLPNINWGCHGRYCGT